MLTVDVIEREHNALCVQIEQKISEVLLKRGDYSLVGELGNLKDRLNAIRKEAKQVARTRDQHNHTLMNKRAVHDERLGSSACPEISRGNYNTEDVFRDDSLPAEAGYNIRQRSNLNLSRIDPRDHSGDADPVMARGQESMRTSSPALLSDSQTLRETHGRRGMDVSQPMAVLQANLPEFNRDSTIPNPIQPWMNIMKSRQDRYEEQLGTIKAYMVSINMTVENTEASHQGLLQAVNHLEDNFFEVSQRLDTERMRVDNLDTIISRVEKKVSENLEMVQEWFVDLTARPSGEIPREIINSIQDVINDSSPGLAVDRLRGEVRDLRDSLSTSQHVTEGL